MKKDRTKIDARSSIEIAQALLNKMQGYQSAIKAKPVKSSAETRHLAVLSSILKSNSTK
jgi:hypothetical protein